MPDPDLATAVDAGARAWFARAQGQRRDDGRLSDDGKPWQWDDITEGDRKAYRVLVAPVVEAVIQTITEETP